MVLGMDNFAPGKARRAVSELNDEAVRGGCLPVVCIYVCWMLVVCSLPITVAVCCIAALACASIAEWPMSLGGIWNSSQDKEREMLPSVYNACLGGSGNMVSAVHRERTEIHGRGGGWGRGGCLYFTWQMTQYSGEREGRCSYLAMSRGFLLIIELIY